MGDRQKARELALMLLYQVDLAKTPVDAAIRRFFDAFDEGAPLDPPPRYSAEAAPPAAWSPAVREFAELLVRGVVADLASLDEKVQAASSNWRLDRMAKVDRNILRLGAHEILREAEDVPRKVAINEAVELAKRFGTAESPAFVNGILDRIGKKA